MSVKDLLKVRHSSGVRRCEELGKTYKIKQDINMEEDSERKGEKCE